MYLAQNDFERKKCQLFAISRHEPYTGPFSHTTFEYEATETDHEPNHAQVRDAKTIITLVLSHGTLPIKSP